MGEMIEIKSFEEYLQNIIQAGKMFQNGKLTL